MNTVVTAFSLIALLAGCNSISSTCSDGDVWLHVADTNDGDLSACSPLQVHWSTPSVSGAGEMLLEDGGEVKEAVFLLSTQNDDDFENDIPFGTVELSIQVVCGGATLADDVYPLIWETTDCEGDEVQNATVLVDIQLDSVQ